MLHAGDQARAAAQGAGLENSSEWHKGARLEVSSQGDWWDAEVVESENNRILIHYVGGSVDEDEWIPISSTRLRPPQQLSVAPLPCSGSLAKLNQEITSAGDEHDVDGHETGLHRPMRRSRMLSDDARLALQLQEEEVKAARDMKSFSRKRSQPSASVKKVIPIDKKVCTQKAVAPPPKNITSSSSKASPPGSQPADLKVKPNVARLHGKLVSEKPMSAAVASPRISNSSSSKARTKIETPAAGMVSFIMVPDETASDAFPSLVRNGLSLTEETTIFQIKKTIIEEVMPGVSASEIDLRTPSGLLLGQDHSLKYVRTFLWPPVKGELVLKYSRRKISLM